MKTHSAPRRFSAFVAFGFALGGCAQFATETGPEPTSNATSVQYGDFGPNQPGTSGFGASGRVVGEGGSGVFGTTDPISVDDSGPFPNNTVSFDPALADLSSDDQALLAGTGINLSEEARLASTLTFPNDDGSAAFFDADIGTTVFFDTNSSELSEDSRATLRSQAAWLNVHPETIVTIEGHADERGTREYNLALGERRASSVRGYLTALGVAQDRVRKISYGKERPVVPGSDEIAWSQNRRTVTVLTNNSVGTGAIVSDDPLVLAPVPNDTTIDSLLNDPILNDLPSSDPLLNDPLLNDPLLNDPLLNDT